MLGWVDIKFPYIITINMLAHTVSGGHAMGDDWTDSQVPMDGYGPLQLHEPKEQGETESGANKALAQSEEAPQAGSSQAEKLPCGEAPSGHSTGILENPVVKEPDEVTKEELVPAHLEPKEVTKEELVPAHPEPKEVSNEEVVPAHSEPMEVTKEELVPADPEPKEVTKEEVVPAHPEPKEVTKEELVPKHLELEEVTKEEVVPAHLEPMEVTKEELVRAHPEPKEVTKEEVVPAHLEPEEVTKEEPIEPEAILVEEVGEGEGGGDKGPFKEEEVKEEPPLVLRCHQWEIKNASVEKETKKQSKGKGRGRGRGRGGRRGRKQAEPEVIRDSDEEEEEGGEPPAKRQRKKTPCAKPKAKGKARAKAKVCATEASSLPDGGSDLAEDGSLENHDIPVAWCLLSLEGVEELNRVYGWGPCALQGKEEGDGEVAGAKGLKRKIETPNEVDEEKPEKQEKEHIKSFARRPMPRSNPAQSRWTAIRDVFHDQIRQYLVQYGFANCSSWEANDSNLLCYWAFSLDVKCLIFNIFEYRSPTCPSIALEAEWWNSCMDALQNHAPADAKKGEIKCPALDFPKLVAEHAQVYLEETCLRMEPESP